MLNGIPLCQLHMPEVCQPPKIPRISPVFGPGLVGNPVIVMVQAVIADDAMLKPFEKRFSSESCREW